MPDYNYKPPSWWNLPEKCCFFCKYWGSGSKRRVRSSHCRGVVLLVTRPDGAKDNRLAVTFADDSCTRFAPHFALTPVAEMTPVDWCPFSSQAKQTDDQPVHEAKPCKADIPLVPITRSEWDALPEAKHDIPEFKHGQTWKHQGTDGRWTIWRYIEEEGQCWIEIGTPDITGL